MNITETIFLNAALEGEYLLVNKSGSLRIAVPICTVIFLSAKSSGWKGGRSLFTENGRSIQAREKISGIHLVDSTDAIELSRICRTLINKSPSSSDESKVAEYFEKFITFCSQGAFSLHVLDTPSKRSDENTNSDVFDYLAAVTLLSEMQRHSQEFFMLHQHRLMVAGGVLGVLTRRHLEIDQIVRASDTRLWKTASEYRNVLPIIGLDESMVGWIDLQLPQTLSDLIPVVRDARLPPEFIECRWAMDEWDVRTL